MSSAETGSPDPEALLTVIEHLDTDNERLRVKALELTELMERAVTQQVAAERRVAELEDQVTMLQSEIEAMHNTKVMRFVRPLRAAYSRLRRPACE